MSDPDPWAAFVAARLDDLAEADWHVLDCSGMPWEDGHCCDAQRWLVRDVAAKREILAIHKPTPMICPTCPKPGSRGKLMTLAPCPTLRALAAGWSGHPGYAALTA